MKLAEGMTKGKTEADRSPIGRAKELRELERHLDSVEGGQPIFLEVVGEPGIGKTTLLGSLHDRADERGMLVLGGRASQFELETPFDPFVDALDDYLATVNPRRLEPLGTERLGELAAAFPALEALADGEPRIPTEERYRVHRSVRALLGLIGAAKPLVLIIDDAHWSDQASLELLRHLVRRPPSGPVIVAIGYRTGTMPETWQALADAALREGDLSRLEVGPLAERDAELLLGDRISEPGLRKQVYETTGGNPFFIRQVAEAPGVVTASGAAVREREGVPRAVLDAIGEEVASLSDEAREALRAGAIAGDPFDPDLAAAAAGIDGTDLLPNLDDLARRGLIRRGASPRLFQFRHPLVWRGVYEGAPAGWRIAAHRRLVDRLAELGASAATRAPHVEAAAQPGDQEAAALLREAAESSVSTAPASAAHWYDAALALLPEDEEQERISLLVAAATTLGSIGRLEESRDRLREAIDRIPPDAEEARVEAIVGCATMESLLRNTPEATRMLTDALDSLSDRSSPQAFAILLSLATLHVFDYAQEDARDWARMALELAERSGMPTSEAAVAGVLSYNEGRLGNIAEAVALMDRAKPLVDSFSRDTAAQDPGSGFWLAVAEMQHERYEDSVRHATLVRDLARDTGQGRWLPQIAAVRGWSLWSLGRVDESIEALDEGIEMAQLTGNRQFEALCQLGRTLMLTPAGRFKEALAAGRRALELSGPVESGDHISIYARQQTAFSVLESGDPAGARDLVLEVAGEDGLPRTELVWQPLALNVLTEAELALGNPGAAESYACRAVELADGFGLGQRRSWAHQALARFALATGDMELAVAEARVAADAAASSKARVDEGRSLILLGRGLCAAGERDAGVAELQRAHDLLAACGAHHFRDQAARELRTLGVKLGRSGRRSGAASGLGSLSDREREIADLVAEGRSNKEIGAALFISPKTVEKHLSKAFEKLGVSKRAQVAAAIERARNDEA
jgi:DNA-binding CsgD family transcriptional regulator/tetratricopeptide (TPR) repeat protein